MAPKPKMPAGFPPKGAAKVAPKGVPAPKGAPMPKGMPAFKSGGKVSKKGC